MGWIGDLAFVLDRAFTQGNVEKIIVTAGTFTETKLAYELCQSDPRLFCTLGYHPTRTLELSRNEEGLFNEMTDFYLQHKNTGHIIAIGEFGLDYDRLKFAPKEIQKKYFAKQFELAEFTSLPLFLHCRSAFLDFIEILTSNRDRFSTGVVHSFTGSAQEAKAILDLDMFIGINGCSLKDTFSIEIIRDHIPIDRIVIETDAPWCSLKHTNAGVLFYSACKQDLSILTTPFRDPSKWSPGCFVKGRNEPYFLSDVAKIIAAIKEIPLEEISAELKHNTEILFPGITR